MRVSEAAAALGVHPNTVRNWVATGRLVDVRPHGAPFIRLDPDQVASLLPARTATPEVDADTAVFRLTVPTHVRTILVQIDRADP